MKRKNWRIAAGMAIMLCLAVALWLRGRQHKSPQLLATTTKSAPSSRAVTITSSTGKPARALVRRNRPQPLNGGQSMVSPEMIIPSPPPELMIEREAWEALYKAFPGIIVQREGETDIEFSARFTLGGYVLVQDDKEFTVKQVTGSQTFNAATGSWLYDSPDAQLKLVQVDDSPTYLVRSEAHFSNEEGEDEYFFSMGATNEKLDDIIAEAARFSRLWYGDPTKQLVWSEEDKLIDRTYRAEEILVNTWPYLKPKEAALNALLKQADSDLEDFENAHP